MVATTRTANGVLLGQRMRRVVLAVIVIAAVYLLAVTPARTWWDQRQDMHAASQRYEALKVANADLEKRAAALRDDKNVEALARDRYELVPAGKDAYAVMPAPSQAVPAGATDGDPEQSWWSKTIDTVEFWD